MKNKSFTLIEILVAVTIFSLIMGIASGIFISAIKAQRKTLAYQQLLDQTSYIMEYMSRALRMAKKDDIGGVNCLNPDKVNFEVTHSGQGIKFRNYQDICQEFYLDGIQLNEEKDGVVLELTSTNLQVLYFNVNLIGETQIDNLQPRVTLLLNIKGTGEKPEQKPEIKIQTTISQRNPDIEK